MIMSSFLHTIQKTYNTYQGWTDLNHDLNKAIKVTKSDLFYFLMFFYLFVVHNCRNLAINVTGSDFFIKIFLFVIQKFY